MKVVWNYQTYLEQQVKFNALISSSSEIYRKKGFKDTEKMNNKASEMLCNFNEDLLNSNARYIVNALLSMSDIILMKRENN